ncbi:unnamed protein product [Clonostachys solani]|uniref:Uncharacterized protein n=1 Tax=Clonostachys solani TaxID=160281 RepID=A0A9N9Z7Y8_9HYPO|nr:unnamed protein product [Clonostachys solani]
MPVTVYPARTTPIAWKQPGVTSSAELFWSACSDEARKCKTMIQSSFQDVASDHIHGSSNGFVYAAFQAYSHHYHLKLRPEDVWFSILVQLSFYINKHAEELKSVFVPRGGEREVEKEVFGTIHTIDFGQMAVATSREFQNYVVDAQLRDWIMPDFTTTQDNDRVVAAILMMGTLQKHFSYKATMMCGIPSVTLQGEREDWTKLRNRLGKIASWGREPAQFAERLKTVLDYFILTFDQPNSVDVKEFWNKIAHYKSGGSGPTYLSGWMTAFCFWSGDGELIRNTGFGSELEFCRIGNSIFLPVETNDIPAGYASVPVKLDYSGTMYQTRLLAGSVGRRFTRSGWPVIDLDPLGTKIQPHNGDASGLDTIEPVIGWWMYETSEE